MLGIAAHWVVDSLVAFAKVFKWREFALVYFIVVIGAAIPNMSVGVFSAIQNVPDLFLGDVIGNTLITITLIAGIAALIGNGLHADSKVVQQSSLFLVVVALLPLLLIMDGELGRGDGIVLLAVFFLYSSWLFSKRKFFGHAYGRDKSNGLFKNLRKGIWGIFLGIPLLILAGHFIVESSMFFADYSGVEIATFGVLFVALGTSLPELFFVIVAARKKNNWLVLGAVIGDVVVLPTLGLGLIAVISPITVTSFSSFFPFLLFLILASMLFLFFIRSGRKISFKEAIVLLGVYVLFVATELLLRVMG